MSEEMVTLFSLAGGGAAELFDSELQMVVENILDPNTDAKAPREVCLKVKIKPDDARRMGAVSISITSKTGAIKGLGSVFYFGKKGGRCFAVENNPQQGQLFDKVAKPTEVDFKTGEVRNGN